MKNKIFQLSLLAVFVAATLSACSDSYEYEPASLSTKNASIKADGKTSLTVVKPSDKTFNILVQRIDSTQAEEVKLESSNSKFSVPATVSFAANEGTKKVTVTYNVAGGSTESATISVAADQAYEYRTTSLVYQVNRLNVVGTQSITYKSKLGGFTLTADAYKLDDGTYFWPANKEGFDYDVKFKVDNGSVIIPGQRAIIHPKYGDVYICGNAKGDAALTADGISGSGVAGTMDATTHVASLKVYHAVPGLGAFGNMPDVLKFN